MIPGHRLLVLALAGAILSTACADRGAEPVRAPAPAASECKEAPPPHWSYADQDAWGDLPGSEVCRTGDRQSPIDLLANRRVDAPASEAPELHFERPIVSAWVNNGHTLKTEIAPGSTLRVGGKDYALVEVHFHVPAEHLLGDKRYAMEMHLVTKDDPVSTRGAKVFGVFFAEHDGAPAALGALLAQFAPGEHGKVCARKAPPDTVLDLAPLMPGKTALWSYDGSLTTPTCAQIVTFYLADQTLPVSHADLQSFVERVGLPSTARRIQPRNQGPVRHIAAP